MTLRRNPDAIFTSADKFERVPRREIAELMSAALEDMMNVDDVEHFAVDDQRLTDEVCYCFVEYLSQEGDTEVATELTLEEHPEIRTAESWIGSGVSTTE